MSVMVRTATRLVTSNDGLVNSLEGIECIMIESLYRYNSGDLQRAWLGVRRAMTIAQMIGLYRQPETSSLEALDPEAQTRISPGSLWFRIVHTDRYFSLVLGLPQGSLENSFATPSALESCNPMERLERLAAVAAGRILQIKDTTNLHNPKTTHDIDELLLEASESMPTQWWLTPDLDGDNSMIVRKSTRIMGQLMHYTLQTYLHLPYIFQFLDDPKYDYNRVTAANASRELLLRFVCCGSNDLTSFHCNGLTFVAFVASTTLCLALIHAHQLLLRAKDSTNSSSSMLSFLTRHRRSNRDLIKHVLKGVQSRISTETIPTAINMATVLEHLLAIEAESESGISYSTTFNPGKGQKSEYGGEMDDDSNILCIYLPHFGSIEIKRGSFLMAVPAGESSKENIPSASGPEPAVTFPDDPFSPGQDLASAMSNTELPACGSRAFNSTPPTSGPTTVIDPLSQQGVNIADYGILDFESIPPEFSEAGSCIW
ncbi:hypothetical protein SLS62_005893 [Diatrype stigma]|uniref:Xylanolytic transcriptional activator regulatory domain-containing protein n=1 Tax=Diatrype stigma TaxID=117547 RepID=A0AAN9YS47_9PEZI